jgi:hypothetical protein
MPELSIEFWFAAIALLLGLGVTLAMDAKTKGEFRFAVACFLVSAGLVVYMIGVWQVSVAWPTRSRLVAAYALFALVSMLTGEAIRWAHSRHSRAAVPTAETPHKTESTQTPPSPPPANKAPHKSTPQQPTKIEIGPSFGNLKARCMALSQGIAQFVRHRNEKLQKYLWVPEILSRSVLVSKTSSRWR